MNEQKPRWGKGAIVMIAAAVVFLLAAGTFGTLWILERNDHSATTEQLTGSRTQAETARTKLRETEDKRKTITGKLQEATIQERSQETVTDKYSGCAEAGRGLANAVRTRNEKVLEEVSLQIATRCF